ncbi:MAG: asparagine synthase (glutamine-hydrolyzing) [Deltaproteobacteria bacterium]|nr:asparagine synthase (glutamine-hydrolyzing) [Deltaproteobacteria bacterium]
MRVDDWARVQAMCNRLSHRGPDAEGFWQDTHVAFAHRRLSILDLSRAGNQPMVCKAGRYIIVFNGEIFNFLELRRELSGKGYVFRTQTDTEVVLAAYDAWGKNCLHRFNGMWAFALWDCKDRSLFLARDRFGIKPLYYGYDDLKLVFASELQALHYWLGQDADLDEQVIFDICSGSFANHGTRKTYLKDAESLPPGHLAYLKNGELKIERWYELSRVDVPRTFGEQAGMFRDLFIDACKLRLRSDVPVGTCLSGGLDSSSIVSVLHKSLGQKTMERTTTDFHDAFCASFPDTPIDELCEARTLSKEVGAKLHVLNVTAPTPEKLERAMLSCDGPMHGLAFYPISELYGFIREKGIKVTLDGQGPDEMLGGYRPFGPAFSAALSTCNLPWAWDLYKTYSAQGENSQVSAKKEVRSALIHVLSKRYVPDSIHRLIKSFKRNTASRITKAAHMELASPTPDDMDEFQAELYNEFFQSPLPGILQQYDRCSMAHGVECRMPFMDYRLVEFVFSLPNRARVGGGYTKRVLREAMMGIVPESIRERKIKIGFNAPIVDWFRSPLRGWMQDIMETQDFRQSAYFDGERLRMEFEDFLRADVPTWNSAWKFWGPVHFTWWKQNNV